jgi:hypothetical protein
MRLIAHPGGRATCPGWCVIHDDGTPVVHGAVFGSAMLTLIDGQPPTVRIRSGGPYNAAAVGQLLIDLIMAHQTMTEA